MNHDEYLQSRRDRYRTNREHILIQRRLQYQNNRDVILKQRQRRYQNNSQTLKAKAIKRYYEDRETKQLVVSARRLAIRQWFTDVRSGLACSCGESDPVCLDFHHRDPTTKLHRLAFMTIKGFSKDKILAEIAKCDVLCANCHRVLHRSRPSRPSRAWVWDLKAAQRCSCGEGRPACLDYHHRDPTTKVNHIATMVMHGLAKKTILAEIAKCDLICANCHRRKHA